MTWEEFRDMAKILLAFNSLSERDQEAILLMIDGLRFRAING
jgi:hypothetical protein